MKRRRAARAAIALRGWPVACAAALCLCLAGVARSEDYAVVGQCRAGVPNGEYELWDFRGRLRVAGAFSQGRKTGTFIFWGPAGARIAVIPYDGDAKSGTMALWYAARDGTTEAGRKLEAPYVEDRLNGVVRSWHPNGAARAEYRYERGELIEARAWTTAGDTLSDAEARSLAQRDAAANRQVLESLLRLVGEHLPGCE